MGSRPLWCAPADAVLGDAGSFRAGLSADEAATRLRRVGPNEPAPPRLFFAILALMVLTYLGLVEVVKRWFYQRHAI